MTTTIEIKDADWSRLNGRKKPGDGFKDAVERVLDQLEEAEAQGFVPGRDGAGVDVDPEPEQRDLQDVEQRDPVVDDVQEASDDVLEELLDDWQPGRSLEEREERKNVGRAALELLIDDGGELERNDFVDELLPEYDVEEQNEDTWWKKSARPAVTRAVDAGLVERHHGPPHTYEWAGDSR